MSRKKKSVSLTVNCGYSRGFILESFNPPQAGTVSGTCNMMSKSERADKFRQLFADCSSFDMPNEYWLHDSRTSMSTFDRHCEFIFK